MFRCAFIILACSCFGCQDYMVEKQLHPDVSSTSQKDTGAASNSPSTANCHSCVYCARVNSYSSDSSGKLIQINTVGCEVAKCDADGTPQCVTYSKNDFIAQSASACTDFKDTCPGDVAKDCSGYSLLCGVATSGGSACMDSQFCNHYNGEWHCPYGSSTSYCTQVAPSCIDSGSPCTSGDTCCTPALCVAGTCKSCKNSGGCSADSDCCSPNTCQGGQCAPLCPPLKQAGEPCQYGACLVCYGFCINNTCCSGTSVACTSDSQCCTKLCQSGKCSSCSGPGGTCDHDANCCSGSGMVCQGGVCAGSTGFKCSKAQEPCNQKSDCCGAAGLDCFNGICLYP